MTFRFAILMLCAVVALASNCPRTSIGYKPLDTPTFPNYQSFDTGLYPGSNKRPASHEKAGREQAASVVPRDAAGKPNNATGKIVLLSRGTSNTSEEFAAFQSLAGKEAGKNPKVVLVNGAQDDWPANRIVADEAAYWNGLEERIKTAGVSDAQVQAAWVELADSNPSLPFPADVKLLKLETQEIIRVAKARFPNLRLVYLSSRIYAGYAENRMNPEPFAYQGGFSVRWLVEGQINGTPDLDYSAGKMPWMAWGPYLWADGMTPRSDGLTWACADFQADGISPSESGQMKVARLLLDFFKNDTTTRPWFLKP